MQQSTSLNEAEIKAFNDQLLFAKPQPQEINMPLIAMWIMVGAIKGTILTISIFTILT
jgi:hypothetical protein